MFYVVRDGEHTRHNKQVGETGCHRSIVSSRTSLFLVILLHCASITPSDVESEVILVTHGL